MIKNILILGFICLLFIENSGAGENEEWVPLGNEEITLNGFTGIPYYSPGLIKKAKKNNKYAAILMLDLTGKPFIINNRGYKSVTAVSWVDCENKKTRLRKMFLSTERMGYGEDHVLGKEQGYDEFTFPIPGSPIDQLMDKVCR